MAAFIGMIIYLMIAAGLAMLPILFAAWAFSKSYRVKEYITLLKQIKNELQRLNDYNEGQTNRKEVRK